MLSHGQFILGQWIQWMKPRVMLLILLLGQLDQLDMKMLVVPLQ